MSNADLERDLESLPDRASDALTAWRKATLDRERLEAVLYLKFKGEADKRTGDEIKSMVRADGQRYQAVLTELMAESEYTRIYERLLASKRLSSLRTAF